MCISYQSLASSAIQQPITGSSSLPSNKILFDWELELGESVIDLKATGTFIVALGEKYLYCVKDTGSILWAKKFDYHPVALTLITPTGLFN